MKTDYPDITSRIAEEPQWWDLNGTPRYGDFKPELVPSVYAGEAALIEIVCQSCQRHFKTGVHWDMFRVSSLQVHIEKQLPLYGDPPNHDCSGATMMSHEIVVLEYWRKNLEKTSLRHTWERVPELEVKLREIEDEG